MNVIKYKYVTSHKLTRNYMYKDSTSIKVDYYGINIYQINAIRN